jgi:2,3-bisphosphoglycerate-independent phosphoglycerate mutase
MIETKKKPTTLVILDGWGVAPSSKGNAIDLAYTPVYDQLKKKYPHTTLKAFGEYVGLDYGQVSGSETGHVNIGAGRLIEQDSLIISKSIKNGSFFTNPALIGAVHHANLLKSQLHVMGLISDSDSPHSNPEHFRAVLHLAKQNGVKEVYCHLFTDGRDSYPGTSLNHLKYYRKIINEERIGKIATISGRFYAMDRSKNWDRLSKAYLAIISGIGRTADSAEDAIELSFKAGVMDEYIEPTVIKEKGIPVAILQEGDSIIFYNLRSDRARQFSKLFVPMKDNKASSDNMPEVEKIKNLFFVAMTNFGPDLNIHTAFPGHPISTTLPWVLSSLAQLYIAETEKYAHVTYFLNGGYSDPVGGEDRVVIDSVKTNNYSDKPEMSAEEITNHILSQTKKDKYDFVAVNFANADMVGHTGNLKAVIRAVEFLDLQLGRLSEKIIKAGGNLVITADHGNAEKMIGVLEGKEVPHTFHTKNPVPFILAGEKWKKHKLSDNGVLGNVAPTILDLLEIEKPEKMRCDSLIIN